MSDEQQTRIAAKKFAADWAGRGDEKQETQSFWLSLLQKVYGVAEPEKYISFERRVEVDDTLTGKQNTKFIDGYIPETRVLIEQKGVDVDLKKGSRQSDGALLSPYQQARRYGGYLPQSEQPRWIVVCNFREFQIHDMNRPNDEPETVLLSDFESEYHRLRFLVDTAQENIKREMEISLKAGEVVGVLYDALLKQYINPESEQSLKSLNILCVRLVFCLYAEDAGIFGKHLMFHDYLKKFHPEDVRRALIDLFQVLDTKPEDRDPYMKADLAAFPYVNGGLFAEESIEIPQFTEEIVDLILTKASEDFDWSEISPTIFGAVFESTLNPETRRSGGMHYTSIENIHKVIDPLFLDGLREELEEIKKIPVDKTREQKLREFQTKLAGLKFLDPACGSGNFLTETYISLRRMENEVITLLNRGQIIMDLGSPIKVSIGQFYGIEINDFAVTVAKTALWIAESQMMRETEEIVLTHLDFLPLKSYANITEGNALRIDWETIVPKNKLNYIMGNPPFVGYTYQTAEQKSDLAVLFKNVKNIDYVGGWYKKTTEYIQNTAIRCALVSTNSITQGEQVAVLWKPLFEMGVHIDFAHRTFRWDSEASLKAHVHCVIVGFSVAPNNKEKLIYTSDRPQIAKNINGYLLDADNIFIEKLTKPICNAPEMTRGSQPTDDGNLILTEQEKDELLKQKPQAEKFIRPFMMGVDFIKRKPRYCLWLVGANPNELKQCPQIVERVKKVKEFRLASSKAATRKKAETPMLFDEIKACLSDYVAIPVVSSENRKYIPIDYLPEKIIAGNKLFMIPNATLYHFGVLTSNVHMAWTRAVCGRLEMRYSYSNTIVYNNFPWCSPTEEQKAKIEKTAQGILDARALYPDSSLADLYDEVTMPPELRKAHQANDRAVWEAYGKAWDITSESACVAELMKMYRELTEK